MQSYYHYDNGILHMPIPIFHNWYDRCDNHFHQFFPDVDVYKRQLTSCGVTLVQGFYYSIPLPVDEYQRKYMHPKS